MQANPISTMKHDTPLIDLRKDIVHDLGGEQYFPIRQRNRRIVRNGTVKGLDQVMHTGGHMEISNQKAPRILHEIPEILLCQVYRRDELLHITLVPPTSQLDQGLLVLIEDESVLRAEDTKLME